MGRQEAFTTEQLTTWHDDMLAFPGVQRVGLDDHSFLRSVVSMNDENDPTGFYRQQYTDEPYHLFTSAVADESARESLVNYCVDNVPGYKQMWGIPIIKPETWQSATSLVSARDIIDFYIRSEHLVSPAAEGHDAWRSGKLTALNDPTNPYRGYGPTRRKVQDLSPLERQELSIASDAEPSADVYHPLDVPFMQLDPEAQNRNVVPMAAACLAVADFLIDDSTTIEELDDLLYTVASGTDPDRQQLLNMVAHVAWAASDLSLGGRPWWTAQENYHPYTSLSVPVQNLDTQAMLPPITYMRKTIATTSSAYRTMLSALKRDGGPYERWWMPEYVVLAAAAPFRQNDQTVIIHDEDRAGTWGLAHRAEHTYQRETSRPAAAFRTVMPNIIDAALSKGHVAHDPDGYWHLTEAGRERLDALDTVQRYGLHSSLEEYISRYNDMKSRFTSAS